MEEFSDDTRIFIDWYGKKINVIDLDNTLLPYNSLIRFVLFFMSDRRSFFPLLYFSILRITGLVRKEVYLKKILIITRKTVHYEDKVRRFGLSLYRDIRQSMIRFIVENSDECTTTVLCTASPMDYVKYLCEPLGWSSISSSLKNNDEYFIHMNGENKISALQNVYPRQTYTYHFALSDNRDDDNLLKLFAISYRIKNSLLRKKFTYVSVKEK